MKKIYILLALFLFASLVHSQTNTGKHSKLSPFTKQFLVDLKKLSEQNEMPKGYAYRKLADGKIYTSALIKVSDAAVAEQNLKNIGVHTGTKAGNIWTVQIPFDHVMEFTELSGIDYIQIDEPVFPDLDMARKTTRVDSVQRGINLPMPYSGSGVIMGIIDFGFDYNHPTFYDTLRSVYRIKRVWELNGVGTPPTGYSYGNEITDTNLIKAQGTDNPVQVHGTMVAGVAAGSGYGSNVTNNRLRGMAFGADYVLVGVRRDTIAEQWMQGTFTDFLDGINYIFTYAAAVGKPAVVNISWGSHSGPHDGTTLFNQACNNLIGPGKILVMSAGNEGQENIHLSKTFTPVDTTLNTFLKFSSNVYQRTWVDAWGDPGKTFCADVTMYSNNVAGNTTGFFCIDDLTHDQVLISANGMDTCFVSFITSSAEFNGKPRITVDIYSKATDSINVAFKGTDGTINLWNEYYYYGFTYGYQCSFDSLGNSWAVNGNTVTTVSDMGSASSVLLVGAYASKVNWTDINANAWTYNTYVHVNRLVPFSSRGPMIDGRIKPDITAPGLTLATSISSYDTSYTAAGTNSDFVDVAYFDAPTNHTYYYAEFSGTSASSPCAAGIVALMLQAFPTLTPQQVQSIIASTAITDTYTGALPLSGTNDWGHGKINAYGAMKLLLQQVGMYNFQGVKLDCVLFPNPNNGSFTLDYASDKNRELNIEIFDLLGSKISSEKWSVSNGMNRHAIDISHQPKGNYVVKISSESGYVSVKTVVR